MTRNTLMISVIRNTRLFFFPGPCTMYIKLYSTKYTCLFPKDFPPRLSNERSLLSARVCS